MKIGILGGSFNPVHNGHLALAEAALHGHGLDEVWFVPARDPPHKPTASLAPVEQRLELLRRALEGRPEFRLSEIELEREGPSYTVDTLREVHRRLPEAELFLLVGSDTYAELGTWREARRLFELARVVAVNRAGSGESVAPAVEGVPSEILDRCRADRVTMAPVDVSSTEIRRRVAAGEDLGESVPPAVAEAIEELGVFRPPPSRPAPRE